MLFDGFDFPETPVIMWISSCFGTTNAKRSQNHVMPIATMVIAMSSFLLEITRASLSIPSNIAEGMEVFISYQLFSADFIFYRVAFPLSSAVVNPADHDQLYYTSLFQLI